MNPVILNAPDFAFFAESAESKDPYNLQAVAPASGNSPV